jgi:hypothetical protein
MIEHLERGQVRTYAYPGGTIPIVCQPQSVLTISGMAQFTCWTVLDIPGCRDAPIPAPVLAILNDIIALRQIASEESCDALAQRDAVNADLELHLHKCWHELHRHVLFGAYLAPPAPSVDPCGFGGADVVASRASRPTGRLTDGWLAAVVVPPQISRCTLVRPLLRCD